MVYGQPPSLHIPYVARDSLVEVVETVDRSFKAREECIEMLKYHLNRAQQRMKSQADKRRRDKQFTAGDWVYVKLQPYRQNSVALRLNQKLGPKFFGPFAVTARVGTVAYELQLPPQAKRHPVFHVSSMFPCSRCTLAPLHLSQELCLTLMSRHMDELGMLAAEPVVILARRLGKKGNRAVVYLLIQWSNKPKEEATCELYSEIEAKFSNFNLAQAVLKGGQLISAVQFCITWRACATK